MHEYALSFDENLKFYFCFDILHSGFDVKSFVKNIAINCVSLRNLIRFLFAYYVSSFVVQMLVQHVGNDYLKANFTNLQLCVYISLRGGTAQSDIDDC